MQVLSAFEKEEQLNLQTAQAQPGLVQSLAEEAGLVSLNGGPDYSELKGLAQDLSSTVRREMQNFEVLHGFWFEARAEVHQENVDFFLSHQWTREDREAIIAQGRKPYVSNVMRRFILSLLGEQVGQRTDWRAIPANKLAEGKADMMNHILRWVAQTNDWDAIESEIFRDGIIGGVGVCGVGLDPYDPFGKITLHRHRPQEFMWDIHSAQNGSLQNTSNLWRGYFVDKASLAAEFPEWHDEIWGQSGQLTGATGYESIYTMIRPKIHAPAGRKDNYSTYFDPFIKRAYGALVFKREFYRRRFATKWLIRDGYSGTSYYYDTPNQAADEANKLMRQYYESGVVEYYGMVPRISAPRQVALPVIDQFIFVGDQLLRVTTSTVDRYPYKFYIPEFYDGEVTSYFEHGKDDQRMRNRILSFIDQMASGVKGLTLVDRDAVPQKISDDQLKATLTLPNQVLLVNGARAAGKNLSEVVHHAAPPVPGTLHQTLFGIVSGDMEQQFGGPNAIGQEAFAGQSGRNAQFLRSQASLANIPAFDALRRFNKQVAEDILYYSQFLDPGVQMMVTDEASNPEFHSILDYGVKSIEDMKFNIIVSEVVASPTERDARLSRLMQLLGQVPDLAMDAAEVILDLSDIDFEDKTKIIQNRDARLQAQNQMEQQIQQFEQSRDMKKLEVQIMQAMVKSRLADLAARNMPSITLTGKLPEGPATQATLLQAAGVEAEPLAVASDNAFHAMLRQEILDMAQEHQNDLTPSWERDRGGGGHQGKSSTGVPTAKDNANRSIKRTSS